MSNDFILTKKNIFSKKECKEIIDMYKNNCSESKAKHTNYVYKDIDNFKYINKLFNVVDKYKKIFKQINITASKWKLTNIRFKHFKPNKNFNLWHSEHNITSPNRLVSLQVYLSDHNCGTEFFNNEVIQSELGKVVLFPAYFTHTHRGQVCPEKKDRYLLTGYLEFFKKGDLE
tara:strand:+ start:275 stop:793 length:519 start_codon:yes stop_codon:yes gene_type:complete